MDYPLNPDASGAIPRPHKRAAEKQRDPFDGLRPWSAITHGIGVVLALIGTILLLARAIQQGADPWKIASFTIYGLSMIGLYTASTLYHSLRTSARTRISLRKYDHASIYLLIAGSYAPVCLTALRGILGFSLLGIVLALTVAGIVMTLAWINCPRWLTSTIYIFMGWLGVVAVYPLYRAVGLSGILWLLIGGILYTIGVVLYALKWPGRDNPRFGCHEIFHVFIVLGSLAQFMMMYHTLLPL